MDVGRAHKADGQRQCRLLAICPWSERADVLKGKWCTELASWNVTEMLSSMKWLS